MVVLGAYTGMRTVGRKSVVELGSHMKRIVNSLSLMRFENSDGVEPETVSQMMSPFRNITSLEHRLVPLLRAGLENYYSNVDPTTATDHPSETKISLMVTYCYESRRPRFAAHFAPLVTPKKHRVKVEIENKARKMPEVKDSQWVRERAALEQHKLHDINEVVLTDDDGNLYEGMASNFFAVRKRETDGKSVVMCAALENILLGTVMKIVMAICEEDGIEFQWGFPRLQDARDNRWEGCFLTSTSRLLLPIEALYVPDGR
ncbi:aminotransferase [Radiomyces spectabilis]|uniref:aminotransferase n=1 Tax=Radiomyces spectabilis TaxID=64574 RepID=UPI00221F21AF|nr:aminotransferase [Radiomyces spectabilis]KAI8384295.1 aminotransferase [Radiomyces spectabilis]